MRQNREAELIELLSFRRKGFTWRELLGKHSFSKTEDGQVLRWETSFPRQTLARHLKVLVQKGLVERVLESRKAGERGRQCTRYRIKAEFWHSWGCLVAHWPAKWIGSRFFLGEQRTRAYSGTNFVRLYPKESQEYREHLKRRAAERGVNNSC